MAVNLVVNPSFVNPDFASPGGDGNDDARAAVARPGWPGAVRTRHRIERLREEGRPSLAIARHIVVVIAGGRAWC